MGSRSAVLRVDHVIYRLDFATDDVSGAIELEIPETGLVRYEAVFSGAAVGPGFLVVRDLEVPRARGRVLEFRADGLWTEMTCETPDEHWSFGLEAFGLRVNDPAEEIGERIAVGYDLEWEIPGRVTGELLVGRGRLPVEATGSFATTGAEPP